MSGIGFNSAFGYSSMLAGKLASAASAIPGAGALASTAASAATDLLQKASSAGSESGQSDIASGDVEKPKSAADRFLEYMNMSDEEKLKYALLAQMGISKDQYDAMSPEQKADIDKKITDRMTEIAKAQDQSGGAAQGIAAKLQTFVNSAQANEKKMPLINFEV